MTFKDFGTGVSQDPQAVAPGGGQYAAEEHSWEQVVVAQNKPAADWEINLISQILSNRSLVQRTMPSGFVTGDFLDDHDGAGSFVFLTPDPPTGETANQFEIRACDAVVNGWHIRFEYSGTDEAGKNRIVLPAPPTGAVRTDLVILEAWRALVLWDDSTNKSPGSQIFRHGNAKAPDEVNLADDITDPTFAKETARRVQIQYRYRVVENVDLETYADGLEAGFFAHTVPYHNASGADGEVTAYAYAKSTVDAGLWVAGLNNNDGVADVGSADGLLYAIPVCAVARRVDGTFSVEDLNNGAVMADGASSRPDGLFADQVVAADIVDLRRSAARDLSELLDKSVQQVMDNSLVTRAERGPGDASGTSFLAHEAIGNSVDVDTHVHAADAIRRYFSDRSVTQNVVAKHFLTEDAQTVTFDIDELRLAGDGFFATSSNQSSIRSVISVRVETGSVNKDGFDDATSPYVQVIENDGDQAAITFDQPITSGTTVFVELLTEYAGGIGVARNMVDGTALLAPSPAGLSPEVQAWLDSSDWTDSTILADRHEVPSDSWWVDPGHRELAAQVRTVPLTLTTRATAEDRVMIGERLIGEVTVDDGVNAPYDTTDYTQDTAYTTVVLNGATPVAAGASVEVTFTALRGLPMHYEDPFSSYDFFYQTRAIQTMPVPSGNQTLRLTPKLVSRNMYIVTSGSGSPDDAFPFVSPSCQIPVGSLPSPDDPEVVLGTPNVVDMFGFGINSGMACVTTSVPYAPSPGQVTLYSDAADATQDADGRSFWPRSDDGSTAKYSPVAFAPVLSNRQPHKAFLPAIMELRENVPSLGRRGSLVLVIFTRWFAYSDQNSVTILPETSDSCAAIYRIKGNPFNPATRPSAE